MFAPNFVPGPLVFSMFTAAPLRPLHTLVRTTEERFRPVQILPYQPGIQSEFTAQRPSADDVTHRSLIFREKGFGRVPTIVVGGLVPDATEQVFLLRRFLLRSGDIYYLNYPRAGFSLNLLCRELEELVLELVNAGQPPVIFAVSFGAGVVVEALRRARCAGRTVALSGLVLVSPVTCVADLIAPGAAKPGTLLGRALKPYLDGSTSATEAAVEKSRALFMRMFEAGAQNKRALRSLMTRQEAERLRSAVAAAIRSVTADGARQRASALCRMISPTEYFSPRVLPLTDVPALILFAECEDAVLDPQAPVRFALERAHRAYFSDSCVHRVVAGAGEPPVQHASLVFHVFEFLPRLHQFYQRVRRRPLAIAA